MVVALFLITLAPSLASADSGNTIVGSAVQWSSAQGDLLVWPHTARDLGAQTQYANLTWKGASTNIDVAFKFPIPITGKIYLWHNISHPATIYDYGSQTSCSTFTDNTTHQNVTSCQNVTVANGSHTDLRYYYDWDDISGVLTHTVVNGSHYYWMSNVAFAQGETKQVQWQYAVPINSSGKWSLLVKRSQDTLESALAGNLFVELDPWWNSSWTYKKNITITNNNASATLTSGYTVNLTFNHASLVSDGKSLASGDDVRVVYNGATELDRINITAFGLNTTTIRFSTQASIPAGGSASNYELYYGNPSAGSPQSNASNVYAFYDDFSSGNINGWGCTSSATCTYDAGKIKLVRNSGSEQGAYHTGINVTGNDYELTADMTMNGGAYVGLITRWNYSVPIAEYLYGVRVQWNDATTVNMWRYNNVKMAENSSAPTTANSTLTLRAWGQNFEFLINGVRYLTVSDGSAPSAGFGGLVTGNAPAVWYDNIRVRKYLVPEPTTSLGGEMTCGINFSNSKFSPSFGLTGTNFTFQVSVNNIIVENTSVNLTVLNASNATVATGNTNLANGSGVATVSTQLNDLGAYTYYWNASGSGSCGTRYPASGVFQGPTVVENTTFSQFKMVPQNVSKLIWSVAWGRLVTGGTTGVVNLSLKDPYNNTYGEFSPSVETSILELRNLNVTLPVIGYELGYYSEVRKVAVSNPTAGLWEMRATQDGNVITFETRVQMSSAG